MKLNKKGFAKAKELIASGQVDNDSDWSFSSEDGNAILGDDNWTNYGEWFLGINEDADAETKAHYKFPFGKDGKLYRKVLGAIRQRAAQFNHNDIYDAAGELFDLLDAKDDRKGIVMKRHIDRIEETDTHYIIHYLKEDEVEEVEEIEEDVIDENDFRSLQKSEGFERRFFNQAEMRVDEENPRRVVGYASVFNSLSEDLGGFREQVSTSAFEDVMGDNVVALINHDMNYPLARTDNGSLKLSVDSKGLRYAFDIPDGLSYGNDLLINLKSGNIYESSFGFIVEEDSWERKDGEPIRTIEKVSRLIDVSPVTVPAYKGTSVSTVAKRNLSLYKETQETKKEKQDLHRRNLKELKLQIIKKK